ncbi:MAG: hypothetical protein M3426_13415 [Actinomycetota bacterium]|nr:hypothetical protein [Actinomycetota bacterium]
MMTHEPAREPVREESPEQPMLPFEESAPARSRNEPTGPEVDPREVWKALSAAMKTEARRDCLRTMREVIGNAPQ